MSESFPIYPAVKRPPKTPQHVVDDAVARYLAANGTIKKIEPSEVQMRVRFLGTQTVNGAGIDTGKTYLLVEDNARASIRRPQRLKFLVDANGFDVTGLKKKDSYILPCRASVNEPPVADGKMAVLHRLTSAPRVDDSIPRRVTSAKVQKPAGP